MGRPGLVGDDRPQTIGGAPTGLRHVVRRAKRGFAAPAIIPFRAVESPPYNPKWDPKGEVAPTFPHVISQACTAAQIDTPEYAALCDRMGQPHLMHRKQWEWCYIVQALEEAGMTKPGRRGVGFGVGTEPITPLLAASGCELVASDLFSTDAHAGMWKDNDQHAASLDDLNRDGICPSDVFRRNVTFRAVDMNDVPDDLADFDFAWSSCALEHLGTLDAGVAFLRRQFDCLKPGGIGVHTTEYNVSSNDETIVSGHTVLYRRRDLAAVAAEFRAAGHDVAITFGLGDRSEDRHVDVPPWGSTHLKVADYGFVITSFGLTVRKRNL